MAELVADHSDAGHFLGKLFEGVYDEIFIDLDGLAVGANVIGFIWFVVP